jgi:predicted DNA-binding transcriptional regulator YafY
VLETSARLLRLLSLLQARPEWSGPDLAARLGVSTRTVRRDVDKLRGLDYPVEVDLGPTGGYRLGAGAALPPLLLDDDEAVAVALTLQTAAGSGGVGVAGLGETALGALVKLERILPDRLRRRVAAVPVTSVVPSRPGPAVDLASLVAVGAACRDRRVLELDYVARDGAESRRRVEPHHLVSWGRRWYLVAWDLGRVDWRTLRIDRCRPRVGPDGLATGPRFTPREVPGGDPAAFVSARVAEVRPFRCRVWVAAPVDVVRERLWTDQVRLEAVGEGTRVHLASDSAWSAALMLTGLDTDFTIEAPDELVEHVRAMAARWTRATQPTAPPTSVPMP